MQQINISQSQGGCLFHYNGPGKLKVINSVGKPHVRSGRSELFSVSGPIGNAFGLSSEGRSRHSL